MTPITIGWNWGANVALAFDPMHDVLDFGWMGAGNLSVTEQNGSVVISVVGNSQSYTLNGITLDELSMDNIAAKDASAQTLWESLVGSSMPPMDHPDGPITENLAIGWHWGEDTTVNFDAANGKIDMGWFQAGQFVLTEMGGMAMIDIVGNDQMYMLDGVKLADLHLSNFNVQDYDALAYIAGVLHEPVPPRPQPPVIVNNPTHETLSTPDPDGAGKVWSIFPDGTDVVGFDVAHDRLDFGGFSVHAFIVVDTAEGVGFRNPWNGDTLIVKGVKLADLDIDNFTAINNNHLREDISGALAWEHGVAAAPHTVYARSHEENQIDRVAFDPTADKVDFLYYASRENIEVDQTDEGTAIVNTATGQELILLGVQKDQLTSKNFEFHMSQVQEDHLYEKLGVAFDIDTIVSRAGIPTAGSVTTELPHAHADMIMAPAHGSEMLL